MIRTCMHRNKAKYHKCLAFDTTSRNPPLPVPLARSNSTCSPSAAICTLISPAFVDGSYYAGCLFFDLDQGQVAKGQVRP